MKSLSAVALCLYLLQGPSFAQEARAPEAATGLQEKQLVSATKHMVVAAHPLAAEAGREILRAGGSAIDAAIAMQLVLGLVEPQSSGLGGGAFIVHWNEAAKEIKTYDGRETAPAAAAPDRFLHDGKPFGFDVAVRSGLSVGVPGVMRALELAHQRHGRLPWKQMFAHAIKLATDGFPMSDRLNKLLKFESPGRFSEKARFYFYEPTGSPRAVGEIVKNPEYAETLATLAEKGAAAFYEGAIADAIVAAVKNAPYSKGDLTREDLKSYKPKEREAVCFAYRARKICGMGPPSSGALAVAQTLKIIEPLASVTGKDAKMSAAAVHLIAEAQKLAFADRNRYIADPEFVQIPSGLLDAAYLDSRRSLIDPARAMPRPEAGLPPGIAKRAFGRDATFEVAGTTHLSIVDGSGNAVAMTSTIESGFGAHIWAAGFLLNNELTDFSFMPADAQGSPIANRIEGGKRPRSSMAPLLVFDSGGRLEIVTGSPGGNRIIPYVIKTLVAIIDWELDAQAAAALPNFGSDGGALQLEKDMSDAALAAALKAYGHKIADPAMTSGTHTIVRRGGRLEGGADPRREGAALGD